MLQVVDHWLVRSQDGILTACDLSRTSTNAYRCAISESVEATLNKSPGISTVLEFVKQENGGYTLKVKRTNTSGIELKSLQIRLESAEDVSTVSIVGQLVDQINRGEDTIAESKKDLEETQRALKLMSTEKADLQASALKSISALIAERNKVVNERKL